MANNEDYLDALTAFSKNPSREIPSILEQYLNGVAKNGETLFHWQLLKPLIVSKMDHVVKDLKQRLSSENIPTRPNVENVRFDVMHARIMDALHKFNGAPFTIQRLCELLVDPKRHYKRSDKFMRGLEKNVLVVSTVDPYGRKVISESGNKHLVNGVDTNGSIFLPRDSSISNLPPVPGWVTTTAALTTRPQNILSIESKEQKPTLQQSSEDSPAAASSVMVSGDLVNSVFAEQEEQPPAVHAEEIIEETVITMDTNEAGSVAIDGGEAMAEEDDEEEMGEDTNASSSSSEELSTSDTSESSGTEMSTTVTSSSEIQARPWGLITSETETMREPTSSIVELHSSNDTGSSHNSDKISEATFSQVSLDEKTDSPSSSEAKSSLTELSAGVDHVSSFESKSELSCTLTEQISTNSSSASDEKIMTTPDDSECHKTESNNLNSMVTSDINSESSNTDADDLPASSTAINTAVNVLPVITHELPLSKICINSGVAASSTSDVPSVKITHLNSEEECDSVAVLERLVDSVKPSHSPVTYSFSLPINAITTHEPHQEKSSPLSGSFQSEEPQAKHSPSASCSSFNATLFSTVVPASDIEPSPFDYTSAESDVMADTSSSDTISTVKAASSSLVQKTDIHGSLDNVDCDIPTTMDGDDCISENVTSPPSQLLSSGDSQGFDVYGDTLYKNNSEEKHSEETQPQESTDGNTLIPKNENEQEEMDQE